MPFWVRSHCFTFVIGSLKSAKDERLSGTGFLCPTLLCFKGSDKMPHSTLLEKSNFKFSTSLVVVSLRKQMSCRLECSLLRQETQLHLTIM